MKILDRYLWRKIIFSFSGNFSGIVLLYIIIDLMGNMGEFISEKANLREIGEYYLYLLPSVGALLSPLALMLSVLFVLGTLSKNNEIQAMLFSGVSPLRIAFPVLVLGMVMGGVFSGLNLSFIPAANAKAHYIWKAKIQESGEAKRGKWKNVHFYGEGGRLYSFRELDARKGVVKGVQIIQYRQDHTAAMRVDAQKGVWIRGKWILYKGVVRTFTPGGEVKNYYQFAEKTFLLPETPSDFLLSLRRPSMMSIKELRDYIFMLFKRGYYPRRELVEWGDRFSFPVANLILPLLIIPFLLYYPKGGMVRQLSLAVGVGIGYYIIHAFSLGLGRGGNLPPLLSAWMPNFLWGIMGIAFWIRIRR